MATQQPKWKSLKVLFEQDSMFPENLAKEVIQEKVRFQKVCLDQTIELIRERETTQQRNVSSIESEIMQVQKDLFLYKCIRYPIMPDNKRKGSLEKALSELQDRRRDEITSSWKDTLKLWQQLLEIAAEYKALSRKQRILFPTNKNDDD
jgi:hypothetical protein